MGRFEFFSTRRVLFGRGQVGRLGEVAGALGKSALVIHNGSDENAERVSGVLAGVGIRREFVRQKGEPRAEDVDAAVEVGREGGCELVVGLGGGSAIDAAKAVAGLLGNGGRVMDYMEVVGKGQKMLRRSLPWIAVPTTAGTGAEVTRNAVIGMPERGFKASIRSEHLVADVAIVDAELGLGVRPEVTAASGMDALCQLIESYTSKGAEAITDGMALKGIELACRSLPRAYENGGDVEAREEMALAALLSGMALTNAGLGAVHGFAAPLGARFPVPHGLACAALLPWVIEANMEAARESAEGTGVLERYATVGRIMAGGSPMSDSAGIWGCFDGVVRLAKRLHIPPLSVFGIEEGHIAEMVELAKRASSMKSNPVALSDEALAGVLRRGIAGVPA